MRSLRSAPAERWPEPLAHLVAGDVGSALASVVSATRSGRSSTIADWQPIHVSHRPGRSTTVQYRVTTSSSTHHQPTVAVVLAHGVDGPVHVRSGGLELVGWRLGADPRLPGLSWALRPERVASTLELIGHPIGMPTLRRRAYRPGRRAVVEAIGPGGRVFLKVVRPARAGALVDIHRLATLTLPVPRVLGSTADGVVAMSALPGRTLRSALTGTEPDRPHLVDRLPGYADIVAHLDRLPRTDGGPATAQAGRIAKLRHQAALIGAVLPDEASALDVLVGRIAGAMQACNPSEAPLVAVHGDLYESQLMVSRGSRPAICGVLDLDTVGIGHRIDDIATLCAHLSTLALRSVGDDRPPSPLGDPDTPVGRYLHALFDAACADHEPGALRARTAARVVGMATGPFRVQEDDWPDATVRRVELARAWLDQPW